MRSGTIFLSDFDLCAGGHLRRAWNIARRRKPRSKIENLSNDKTEQGYTDMDIIMLGTVILSFAVLFAYTKLCDNL